MIRPILFGYFIYCFRDARSLTHTRHWHRYHTQIEKRRKKHNRKPIHIWALGEEQSIIIILLCKLTLACPEENFQGKFTEQEKRQNLLNSHIESKEIKAIRRIMDQSSSFQPCFAHPRIPFIGHSSLVIIRYFCIITSFVTRTHQSFPFLRYISGTFICCVYLFIIFICFGIRVFFGVTKSMSENGIKNHQAPNTKITKSDSGERGRERATRSQRRRSYKCKREEEKCVYRGKSFCFFQEWMSTRAIASWLFYHHIHTRSRIHIFKIHTFSVWTRTVLHGILWHTGA